MFIEKYESFSENSFCSLKFLLLLLKMLLSIENHLQYAWIVSEIIIHVCGLNLQIETKILINLQFDKRAMTTFAQISLCFRRKFIQKMFAFRKQFPGVYRTTECLAIAISDLFQTSCNTEERREELGKLNLDLYALTVFWIACKAHGYPRLRLQSFIEEVQSDEKAAEIRNKFIELESFILQAIDFNIPLNTAYDLLNDTIPEEDFIGKNRKQITVRCLKIFMNSLQNDPLLSLRPQLGPDFYSITKYKKGRKQSITLYKQSKKRLIALQVDQKN